MTDTPEHETWMAVYKLETQQASADDVADDIAIIVPGAPALTMNTENGVRFLIEVYGDHSEEAASKAAAYVWNLIESTCPDAKVTEFWLHQGSLVLDCIHQLEELESIRSQILQ